MVIKTILSVLSLFVMLSCSMTGKKDIKQQPGMCSKLPMAGEVSLRTEPGVLTMYAVSEKENPGRITILETYASQEAYKSHIASEHFQKYKQGTLHMVKTLVLSDQMPLNPANCINNFIQ